MTREMALQAEDEQDAMLAESARLEHALRRLDVDPAAAQALKHCAREMTVHFALMRDSGEAVSVMAHRVRHATTSGLTIGPMLLRADITPAHLRALAARYTWQLALLGIPAVGAAGAVICDPQQLSEHELRHAIIGTVRELWRGCEDDLICDGAPRQALAWMASACPRSRNVLRRWRDTQSVHPNAVSAMALLEQELGGLAGARIAVQGLGRLGRDIVNACAERGAVVVAVADVSGGAVADHGIDIAALTDWVDTRRLLFGFPGAESATNAEVLESKCDALVLAAAERQIGLQNAERLRAGTILDAVCGGTTAAAQEWLHEHGVRLVADTVATAGATIAAWMEWTGNSFVVTPASAAEVIRSKTLECWNAVCGYAAAHRLSRADAALELPLSRIAESSELVVR